MQTHTSLRSFCKPLFAFLLTASFSLTASAGGNDAYKVYLNDKLLVNEDGLNAPTIKSLQLSGVNANDQLVIHYTHCGPQEMSRRIVLKDKNDKVYGEWKFADNTAGKPMKIAVNEILKVADKSNIAELMLAYSSNRFNGYKRSLTAITFNNDPSVASARQPIRSLQLGVTGAAMLALAGGLFYKRRRRI